jgi:hypothetical protein
MIHWKIWTKAFKVWITWLETVEKSVDKSVDKLSGFGKIPI